MLSINLNFAGCNNLAVSGRASFGHATVTQRAYFDVGS
jgi:hypothetical protein